MMPFIPSNTFWHSLVMLKGYPLNFSVIAVSGTNVIDLFGHMSL